MILIYFGVVYIPNTLHTPEYIKIIITFNVTLVQKKLDSTIRLFRYSNRPDRVALYTWQSIGMTLQRS